MKRIKSIQIKAALLLVVFSLNTIIGFACSIGLDKVFATSNHHDAKETKAVVHVHADGKKHLHHKQETTKAVVHVHADGKKHIHHEKSDRPGRETQNNRAVNNDNSSKENKEGCCTTKVTKFEQLDKSVPQSLKFNPVFFAALVSEFYNIDIIYTSFINTSIRYFVRSYHPPIPNIRIAIQSFQI